MASFNDALVAGNAAATHYLAPGFQARCRASQGPSLDRSTSLPQLAYLSQLPRSYSFGVEQVKADYALAHSIYHPGGPRIIDLVETRAGWHIASISVIEG